MGLGRSLRTVLLELERSTIVGQRKFPAVAESLEGDEEESLSQAWGSASSYGKL